MSTTTAKNPDAWWAEDGPIPFDNEPEQFRQPMVVRQQERQQVQQRSEYGELAALAQSVGARDSARMLAEAKRVGALLGSRAFYDFPAGGGRVTGPTIDLMDALAIVWGRLVSEVAIVEETDVRVHLRGCVVDLLALTAVKRDYVSAIAPAPGAFARKPDQADRWRTMQLQSASSKAIRGALEHALPVWLVDAALDAARDTVAKRATGGVPLPQARANAIEGLARLGLTAAECAAFVGQPVDLWAVAELDALRVLVTKLKAGELSVEGVRAELVRQAATAPSSTPTDRFADLGVKPAPAPAPQAQQTPSAAPPAPAPKVEEDPEAKHKAEHKAARDQLAGILSGDGIGKARVKAWAWANGIKKTGGLGLDQTREALAAAENTFWDTKSDGEPVTAVEPAAPSEDTLTAIGEWCLALSGDKVDATFASLGIDPEKGPATEAQAQALLAALKLAGA
jgi:hypothetical protein